MTKDVVKAKPAPKAAPARRSASPDPWSSDEEAGRADAPDIPRLNLAAKLVAVAAERTRGDDSKRKAQSTKTDPSRARVSSAVASSETAVEVSKEPKAKDVGKHSGQPKLVLAPTHAEPDSRVKTRRVGSSATLVGVEEEDETESRLAEKDSWAVL
jgi:hypothetical protein